MALILVGHGLPTIRIHDVRHSRATLLLMQGVSPRVVMEVKARPKAEAVWLMISG